MSKALIVFLFILGLLVVGGIGCGATLLGFRSDCVQAEAGLDAQYKANQSSYDNMWKTFKEMAQVPDMYVDGLKKVYDGTMQGRYGADGAKQTMLFVKEQNPNFDSSMYTKLQTAIEASRRSFNQDQKELLDRKAQYVITLNDNTGAIANIIFHFPHVDLSKYDIVTSDETDAAFKTNKAGEIKLH